VHPLHFIWANTQIAAERWILRLVLAHLLFGQKGNLLKVLQGTDVFWLYTGFVPFFPVDGSLLIGILELRLKLGYDYPLLSFLRVHGFQLFVPEPGIRRRNVGRVVLGRP